VWRTPGLVKMYQGSRRRASTNTDMLPIRGVPGTGSSLSCSHTMDTMVSCAAGNRHFFAMPSKSDVMKNALYKLLINNATTCCYETALNYFPAHSSILDVGIGNGIMLTQYHTLIKSKALHITGIDINASYLKHCHARIQTYNLGELITISHDCIETYTPPKSLSFDFIFFSMSFMLFENQQYVLTRVQRWLKPEGKLVFFQTMYHNRFILMEFIKPRLKYITSIDFGRVTYDSVFFSLLETENLTVLADILIRREWFKGEYRLIVACPRRSGRRETTRPKE